MAAIIDIQQVDFAYGQQLVLKQITLPVEAGSTLGVVGPNGGGKTTLLRLLLGQVQSTRGTVSIAGLQPRQAVRGGGLIGYLPQRHDIAENLPISVRQAAQLGLAGKVGLLRTTDRADLDFVNYLLQRVGIDELADRPVGTLSGGQRQRLLIARALAPRPRVLLLDEPTTGIDRSGRKSFVEFVQGLKEELALTLVLVSHDLRVVTRIADRIACLNVTLHYHDAPSRMPEELAREWLGDGSEI